MRFVLPEETSPHLLWRPLGVIFAGDCGWGPRGGGEGSSVVREIRKPAVPAQLKRGEVELAESGAPFSL